MKQAALILILCFSRLFSQVSAPDLRCLEVLSNGNVKLTWIPPADPGNQFSSYDVYYSTTKNGTYTLVPSALNSLTLTNFVHTAAASYSKSCYYYMITRYSGGSAGSAPSDTLRSIFLTAFKGNKTQDIEFNYIHQPKLPSTNSFFTLHKEYPLGTWNTLAILTGTLYPDTIDVCLAKMTYSVSLPDESGCISTSNILGPTTYSNTKAPEEPYVDSISVLPNGNTVLAWQVPVDRDIEFYKIFYRVGGSNQPLDLVPGRNSTFYTYTTTAANTGTVGIFVLAVDSCDWAGNPFYDQSTMYLTTFYDRCAYRTTLRWNRYRWYEAPNKPKHTTLEYRIYYSEDNVNFTRIGATTDTSFTDPNTAPGKNISYYVRVVNVGETITASSNRSSFFSGQVEVAESLYIKTATILNNTSAEIRLFVDTSKAIGSIEIQRSEDDTSFNTVGFVPFNGSPHHSFTDNSIESGLRSYSYRAVIRDSCGNPRGLSNISRTILLKISEDDAHIFTKHLDWSTYSGFAGNVSGYTVYRIVNDRNDASPIATTDAQTTSFTDNLENEAPNGAKIEYFVQALEGVGNPHGILEISNSNVVPVFMEGRLFIPTAFAPEGVNKTWLPVTHFVEKTEYTVRVFNRWGKKVFETTEDTQAWDGENSPPGVYVYLISYKNGRGEYMEAKGTVMLIR